MISRRTLLGAVAATGAATAVGLQQATSADAAMMAPPTLSGVNVGFTAVNTRGSAITGMPEFQADIDRIIALGANSVRLGFPMFLAGGVFAGRWRTESSTLDRLAAQAAYAKSRGLRVLATVAAPAADPNDSTFDHYLDVNRQGIEAMARAVGTNVDAWQVLNEWNLGHYQTHKSFNGAAPTPAYVDEVRQFLTMAAGAIHSVRSEAVVTSAVGGYPADQVRWAAWEKLYATVGGSLDAWGVVAYPDPNVASQWDDQAAYVDHMERTSGKPVIIVETGTCTPSTYMRSLAVSAVPGMILGLGRGKPLGLFGYSLRDLETGSGVGELEFGVHTTNGDRKAHWDETRDAVVRVMNGTA